MKQVANYSRKEAKAYSRFFTGVWISIMEPNQPHIENEFLDKCPNLKIKFWDTTKIVKIFGTEDYAYPPTKEDAKQIVDFLIIHKDRHVIVNCAAGISRSGAVAQFCSDFLGHEWMENFKVRAYPNSLLYRMMMDYYLSFNPPPTKIVDKRGQQ